MHMLKHFASAGMLVWYAACAIIGWLVGSYFGSPVAGAMIGLASPLVITVILALAGWLFLAALNKLLSGR